jgi:hypothetical protein
MGITYASSQLGIYLAPYFVSFSVNHQVYPLILFSAALFILTILPFYGVDDSRKLEYDENTGKGLFEIEE